VATAGKVPSQPKSVSFFAGARIYGASQSSLREDGHKWEPILRATRKFRAGSLATPCFDIYYHHRVAGGPHLNALPIAYVLLVSIHAPKVADFYNQVVRAYRNRLSPLRPSTRLTVRH
jgi:hypothetical protein